MLEPVLGKLRRRGTLPAGKPRGKGELMAIDPVDEGDWKRLLQEGNGPCVSFFMPTYLAEGDLQQDRVRLKNLLREAGKRLAEQGWADEAAGILKPVKALLQKRLFWKQQARSLAVFCASDFFRCYRLPLDLVERLVVSGRFYLSGHVGDNPPNALEF